LTVVITVCGKTTDMFSAFLIQMPLQVRVLCFFSTATAFIDALQVLYYQYQINLKSECTSFEDIVLARDTDKQHEEQITNNKTDGSADVGSVDVFEGDKATIRTSSSSCTAIEADAKESLMSINQNSHSFDGLRSNPRTGSKSSSFSVGNGSTSSQLNEHISSFRAALLHEESCDQGIDQRKDIGSGEFEFENEDDDSHRTGSPYSIYYYWLLASIVVLLLGFLFMMMLVEVKHPLGVVLIATEVFVVTSCIVQPWLEHQLKLLYERYLLLLHVVFVKSEKI
jgi:hypothetical protein